MLKQTITKTLVFCAAAILATTQISFAQINEFKITTSDGAASVYFGRSVSISGDYAIVGANGDDENGYLSGSAYVFKRTGTSWAEEAKLTASDGVEYDQFGGRVSISGDYAIVGAMFDDDIGYNSGSAYVFKRVGTSWSQEAKLLASDGAAGDYFGSSVSISGDYAVVGAKEDDDYKGSAYVYKRTGTSWIEEAKLTASDGATSDEFGESVSISGDYVIVGATFNYGNVSYSGSAYVFKRIGISWSQEAKLLASDGAAVDYFGYSVSISGDYAIVGAYQDDDSGDRSGSAYVFKHAGTSWSQEAKLIASDGAAQDEFGGSVSIFDDYAIVGASADDDNGNGSGSAYVFKHAGTSWSQEAKLTASDGATSDEFGGSVSISGDFALVGATGDDDNGNNSGSAYVYNGYAAINTPPIITSDSVATAIEGVYFSYAATAVDSEGAAISFTFEELAPWLSSAADSVFGTPGVEDEDTSFVVIASDGSLQDTLRVELIVAHPPVVSGLPDITLSEGVNFPLTQLNLDDYATDADDSLSALGWTVLPLGNAGAGSDTFKVSINADRIATLMTLGNYSNVAGLPLVFTATDLDNASGSDTMVVTVTATNDPPVLVNPIGDATFDEDEVFALADLDTVFFDPDLDFEGDLVTFSAYPVPYNSYFAYNFDEQNVMHISFLSEWSGAVELWVIAADSSGATITDIVQVTVSAVNDTPVVSIPDVSFNEDTGDTLRLHWWSGYGYIYDVDDSYGSLDITVAPAGSGRQLQMIKQGNVKSYLFFFPTGDRVEDILKPLPSRESTDGDSVWITIEGTRAIFRATANYHVSGVPFVFTATDPAGASASDSMTVTVNPVNDRPYASHPIADITLNENDPDLVFADLDTVFADVEDSALTFSSSIYWINPSPYSENLSISIDGDNVASLSLHPYWNGTATIRFYASDGQLTGYDQISVNVNAVNYDPLTPSIIFPNGDELTTEGYLVWVAAFDPDFEDLLSYHIQVDDSLNFTSPEIDVSGINAGTFLRVMVNRWQDRDSEADSVLVVLLSELAGFENLNDDAEYHWRIQTFDDHDATSLWTDGSHTFFYNEANNPPNPVISGFNPADSLEVGTVTPIISWDAANDPDFSDNAETLSYSLQVSPSSDLADANEYQTEPGITFVEVEPLIDDAIYFYRIQTWDDEGLSSGWSDTQAFITNTALDPPDDFSLLLPSNEAGTVAEIVTFKWESTSDRDFGDHVEYILYYSTEGSFTEETTVAIVVGADTSLTFAEELSDGQYYWKVVALDTDSLLTWASNSDEAPWSFLVGTLGLGEEALPVSFGLSQNYPNPFNPLTTIEYALPVNSKVSLIIHDVLGREIIRLVNGEKPVGYHRVVWNGRDIRGEALASGIYVYRIVATGLDGKEQFVKTNKLLLLK